MGDILLLQLTWSPVVSDGLRAYDELVLRQESRHGTKVYVYLCIDVSDS